MQKTMILILTFFSCLAFCDGPRLLITLGPKCRFSADGLHKKIPSHLIKNRTEASISKKITLLDRTSKIHTVIVKNPPQHMYWFCRNLGYASIHVTGSLKQAIKQVKEILKTIPTTDSVLPRIPPKEAGRFYDLLTKVDTLFKKHGITYWATCGTLLGAIRHQGMIPWDDDIDLAIFESSVDALKSMTEELSEMGLSLHYYPSYEYYQIFFNDGKNLFDKNGNAYPWKYPYIDIFPMTQLFGKYTYTYKGWQELCSNDYYEPEQLIEPLPQITFGPTMIPIPRRSLDYITRVYHDDWNSVAYVDYNHAEQKFVSKIKVTLFDRSAPLYELP